MPDRQHLGPRIGVAVMGAFQTAAAVLQFADGGDFRYRAALDFVVAVLWAASALSCAAVLYVTRNRNISCPVVQSALTVASATSVVAPFTRAFGSVLLLNGSVLDIAYRMTIWSYVSFLSLCVWRRWIIVAMKISAAGMKIRKDSGK